MSHPAKDAIRLSFERAAASYNQAAALQRRVCERLALGLPPMMTPGIVADVGCGTGYALHLLRERFPPAWLIGIDLAGAMLRQIRMSAHRLGGDAEALPLASDSIGLYWSSLTLQWCDLPRALAEAARVVWPGGHVAIATLGPATFTELREAFTAVDDYPHTLPFVDTAQVEAEVAKAGLKCLKISQQPLLTYHDQLPLLIASVRAIGATQVGPERRRGLMSRAAWQRLVERYETLRTERGLPLTYDVILLHAKK